MNSRRFAAVLLAAALALGAGCGTEPDPKPPGPQPTVETPESTIVHLIAAYERKQLAPYRALFTGDFRFEFSNNADPTLAAQWPGGWPAADESLAAKHLFEGGTNLGGAYWPGASFIDLTLTKTAPVDDTEGRDPALYKMLSTAVDLVVEVPPTPPYTDPTLFVISNNAHRFYLVRGDAAVGLMAGQPADTTRWYIWLWKDVTSGPAGAPAGIGEATIPQSWGKVKGLYR
jgi:hypothetical protein